MPYSLTLPNGFVVENIPDNIPRDQAMGMLEEKMPDAFPGIGEQLLRAPLEVGKGFIRGITTDPASGIASLAYTGARAGGADLVPFEQTQFGQTLGEAQSALAPGYGTIPQFFGGVGSLLSYIPGGLLKGGIGLATRLTQAGATGSEEARARAEESRVLGEADATAGEQFASQVLGTGIGFSELLPIENLVRPVQAVLRGIPASQADAIAPGLFNSAKRMLTTGGIEGLQEGMANIAQDLIAKGIYNPDLEVGESALGDAAMGASVGAFAQGAIDLMTRGKRRSIYEQLKQEERDTEDQSRREALAQQEAEKLARAQEGLGFTEALKQRQEVLRLPAPAVEVDDVPGPDPLRNPLGNFTEGDLTPEVTQELNRRRKEAGLPTLKNFSIEDLADLDAPQAQIDAFIANRLNQQGIDVGTELETQLAPRDVLGFAQSQGVDTSTVGFTDFLRRTTGADDLNKMSPVQRLATISALRQVPEGTGILPQGTNATRFTDQQYNKAVNNVKKAFPDTDILGQTSVIQEIKDFSGLTNDRDAESLLQTAIRRGDLTTISKPIFEVIKDGAVVRKYNTRKSAEEAASKLGFGASVRERTLTEIGLPGDLKSLPGGPDIRKGTFQEGTEPVGYDVRSDTGVLSTSRTLDEANKKADSYTAIRQRKADELQEQITKSQAQIDRSQSKLEEMEATGQAGTTAYAKAAAGIANNNKNLTAKIERLNKERASLLDPVTVAARGQKPITREGYTLFDGETPVGTFPNQQAAEQAAISRYDEDMLQRIADTGDRQRGLKPKRLAQLARDELARRSGEGPQGFGVEITGTPEAAEQRLEQAGVFTRRAQDQINELQKKLLPALKKLGLESVGLRIVRSIQEGGADGFYAQRLITVALDATDPMGTLRHESIHALKELGAFKPNEWKILERRAKEEWIDRFLKDRKTADGRTLFDAYKEIYQQANGNLNGFDAYITEEAIADAFKYFNDNKATAGLITNLMQRLKKFFDALENAFKGLGFQTADDVFTRADTGMLQPLKEEIAPGVRRSQLRTGQSEDIETTGDKRPFSIEQARIYERELENLVKRVGSRIAGMDSTKTLTDVKAAIKKLQRYASEGISGKEWYERSAKAVLDQFNGDPVLAEKFFQLIAITSAGTEVKANFTKASKAWEQFATGQAIKVGTGRENRAIDDLLNFGVDWDGRKTNTFYQNLMEAMLGTDTGRSTIDLHMARMLFDRDAPTDAQYDLAENMIRLLSTKTGLPARQIQAASWVTQKAKGIFQDYRKRGLKKAMTDAELRQHAFNMAITDYAHLIQARGTPPTVTDALREPSASIRTRVQTATGDVIPSVKSAMSQVAEMPYKDKESLNKAILNDGMVQSIAEALGIKSKIRVTTGKGGYKQSISPNQIVQVVNPNPQQAYQDSIDLTDAMSFVFQQEATPFFRADPALIDSGQIGYKLRFARPKLTDTQDRQIFRALIEELGPDAGFSKTKDNEYVVINYRDAETGVGLSDPEFMEAVARFRDKANQITEIEDATAFGADSEYRSNNWAKPGTGETLLAGIQDRRRDRSNLSGGLTNLRKSFVGKARDAVRATGVIPRFSLRPTELAGRPSPGGGIVLGESRQPNAASYTGIHYGKERVNSLAGAFYGTGIKGSEAKRLRESQDPRIKRRVYFYIPDTDLGGRMPKPEGGLGQHVYRQSFDNILPPGEEMTRLYNEAGRDSNAFESAVLDKGYDGYAIPSMGMMVVMDHNVPVNYLGDRDDVKGTVSVDGQLFSLRATDTPEFKQWFGDSKIVTGRDRGPVSGEDIMNWKGIRGDAAQRKYWSNLSEKDRDELAEQYRMRFGEGEPLIMYHGTARDITEFRPKQANAIFVTGSPRFAAGFTGTSETFMAREMFDNASPDQRNEWIREAVRRSVADGSINRATANNIESNLRSGEPVTYQTIPVEVEVDAIDVLLENLPSNANIMPLYVRAENPFDFQNNGDVQGVIDYIEENKTPEELYEAFNRDIDITDIRDEIDSGKWLTIENPLVQEAIRFAGHDGFYVVEGGQKNLAVYDPNQIKSAIGNIGTFSSNSQDIRFSLALGSLDPTTALIPDRGGNARGNLGMMPEQFDGKPIRLLIGEQDPYVLHKGYGANHILAVIMDDPRRAPAGSAELLDRVVSSVQDSSQKYTRIYETVTKTGALRQVLYDGKNVVFLSPERDHYSVITSYAMPNPDQQFGKPVWQGRAVSILPEEVRGLQVESKLGRVAIKQAEVKTKKVYSPAEIARLAEEMPLAAFVEPVKKGTLSLKKKTEGKLSLPGTDLGKARYSLRSTTPPPEKIRKFFDQEERLDISPEVAEIREAWIGGVADSGLNDAASFLHSVSGGRDHTKFVQKMAREMLGNRIKAFRLMSTEELENIRSGDLDYYASFTLNPSTALNFANFVKNRRIAPRDLVVVEADLNPGDIHMLGSPGETEVVADMSRLGGDLRKIQEFAKPVRFSVRTGIDPAIVGSIERTTTTRQEQGFGDRMAEAISPTSFTKFRAGFINTYERIEQNTIRRAAEQGRKLGKEFGDKELLAENSAIAAALMSDRASGIAAEAFKRGIPVYDKGYTFVDNKDGSVKGLMEILVPLAKTGDPFTYRAFQFYAAAKRGKRLDREGREQVFTKKEQLEAEALKNHFMDMDIDFDSIFNEYQKFNSGLVKYMVDTGVISKAMGEKWTENWDYIPFYRQLEGGVTPGPNVFQSLTGVAVPKKLKGGSAPLADFLETIVRNTRSAIEAGMNNIAAQRVIRDALELNDPANSAPYARKLGPGERLGSDVVTVREEGKDVHYQVTDPLLIQALKGLNMPQFPFLEILAKPAQLLRELVTKDPGFMMANLLRDSLQAWGTGQQITPIVDTFKQYGKVLANMSPEAQKLMRAGVGTGYEFKGDVEASTDEFAKQLRAMAGQRTTTETALLPLSKAWDALDRASTASDLATRAEVFKRVFEDTGSEAEAVFQAIEVMNFSRKGSNPIMQIAAASIPFLNARIQGLDLLYRAGFGKLADKNNAARQKAFFVRGATMIALSSLYWLMASETEEWKTAEPEARDNNWIIGPVRIPIPFELGVIFKVAPERTLEYFFGDDTSRDLKQSFVRNLTSTLGVNPIPQAVLPIFENYVNYSFFTGQPIVGRGLEDVSKPFQVNTSTSMFAKRAGETLGMSPVQIDNLIRGYTGTIGGYAVMAMDAIFRGEGDPTKAEMRAEQLPVIKRFFATPQGTGTMTAYYELKKAVDESVRTVNFLERGGRVNEMAEYMQKHANLIAITPYVRSLDKEVTMLRDMKRVVNNSQMDPDQKREALDAIRLAEVNMTRNIQQLKKLADR